MSIDNWHFDFSKDGGGLSCNSISKRIAIPISKLKFGKFVGKVCSNRVAIQIAIPSGLPNTHPHSQNLASRFGLPNVDPTPKMKSAKWSLL